MALYLFPLALKHLFQKVELLLKMTKQRGTIDTEVAFMQRLLEDLDKFSRAGRPQGTLQPVELGPLVAGVRRDLEGLICATTDLHPLPEALHGPTARSALLLGVARPWRAGAAGARAGPPGVGPWLAGTAGPAR